MPEEKMYSYSAREIAAVLQRRIKRMEETVETEDEIKLLYELKIAEFFLGADENLIDTLHEAAYGKKRTAWGVMSVPLEL